MNLLVLARPCYTKVNKNRLNINISNKISNNIIDNKDINLSNSIRKIRFGTNCFITKARLVFI